MSLRPAIPEACRAALRDADAVDAKQHISTCSFCAARQSAPAALAGFAAARPEMPAELASPALLEGVYERAVEMAEQGPVAEWLDAAPTPTHADEPQWQDSMIDSELARELVRRPVSPTPEVWSDVRRTIFDEVSAEAGVRRRKPFNWRILLAGAAAAAVIATISVSNGTKEQEPIVFTELGEAPDVPFAIVRFGPRN